MKYMFISEFTEVVSYTYEIGVDDDCEITQDVYNDYYVDGMALSDIIEKLEEKSPDYIKYNGVVLYKKDKRTKIISSAEYLLKKEN